MRGPTDDILAAASKAAEAAMSDCLALMGDGGPGLNWTALLDHFIGAIQAERERCAKIADERYAEGAEDDTDDDYYAGMRVASRAIAAAIRKGEA